MRYCLLAILIYFSISMLIFYTTVIEYLQEIKKYHSSVCLVDSVYYPNQIPNKTSSYLWEVCDCGRRCESLAPCMQVFTTVETTNNTILLKQSSLNYLNPSCDCTFKDDNCENGLMVMIDNLDKIKKNSEYYINLMLTNSSFDCYTNGDNNVAFLNNELPIDKIQEGSVILGFSILSFILYIIYCFWEWKDKKLIKG